MEPRIAIFPTKAFVTPFWIEPCITIFSIPFVALHGVFIGLDEACPRLFCLSLSQAQWHLPQQRRQALRRVCFRSSVRPVQQRVDRQQLELFLSILFLYPQLFPGSRPGVLVHIPRAALLSDAMVTSDCIPICSKICEVRFDVTTALTMP